MSEKLYYEEPSKTIQLRIWALGQMVWGAFLAGAGVIALALVLLAIWGIGLLLPEESKQAPPPMGWVITAPADVQPA